jgi:hypothetical protein
MPDMTTARPQSFTAGRRAAMSQHGCLPCQPIFSHVVAFHKRGRLCRIGKVVQPSPLGQWAFCMPYRNRQSVDHVSVPLSVLAYLRQLGVRWWIVRLDTTGECFALPLERAEVIGWLHTSEGMPERFVSLSAFGRVSWQSWPFVEATITVPPPGANTGANLVRGG